jgi:hypothetical protein
MIDRALAIAGLAVSIISLVLPTMFPAINRKIAWGGLACGVLLLGAAGGIAFFPDGEAQTPTVNQGPGSAYSYGQQGGITAGTINIGPGRLAFSDQLGRELLAHMPTKKKVRLTSIGPTNADQAVGTEIQNFLQQNGYDVERSIIGMSMPAPDRPISFQELPDAYVLTVAPSAH